MLCSGYESESGIGDFVSVFRATEVSGIQFRYFLYIGISVIYEVVEIVSA